MTGRENAVESISDKRRTINEKNEYVIFLNLSSKIATTTNCGCLWSC